MFIEVFGVVFLSCLFGIPEVGSKLAPRSGCAGVELYFQQSVLFGKEKGTGKSVAKRNCCILGFTIPATDDRIGVCSQSKYFRLEIMVC